MSAHLQYSSSTGHLLRNASSGHLANVCAAGCECEWSSSTCYWTFMWSAEWWCGSGFLSTPNQANGNLIDWKCVPCCVGGDSGECDADYVATLWSISPTSWWQGPNGFYNCDSEAQCILLDTWYVSEITYDFFTGLPMSLIVYAWTQASTPESCDCVTFTSPSSSPKNPPSTFTPDACICNDSCC